MVLESLDNIVVHYTYINLWIYDLIAKCLSIFQIIDLRIDGNYIF